MTTETTPRKKKRLLTNIDFRGDKAHLALTSKSNGPANGAAYALVLKSSNFSQEYITKIQQVQVTLELPDFLRKFFSVYCEDAEILARFMGYVPPEDTSEDWNYENYIQEKVDSFTILKSLNDSEDKTNVLSTLSQEQYLKVVTDQQMLEKAIEAVAKTKSQEQANATPTDTSKIMHEVKTEVSASTVKLTKGKTMTKPVDGSQPEMVEKSAVVSLEKAIAEQKEQLEKALSTIFELQAKEKEQLVKSKTAQFAAVIKDEKVLTPIVKAALALEQEDFDALLGAVTAMQAKADKQKETLEKSSLFTEQGASLSVEQPVKDNAVARILNAQLNKVGA